MVRCAVREEGVSGFWREHLRVMVLFTKTGKARRGWDGAETKA